MQSGMPEVATPTRSKGFVWRAVVTPVLIVDYFLFATGNPSITYSFLSGLFWLPLFAALIIVASFVPVSFNGIGARPFYLLLFIVITVATALFLLSSFAVEFARRQMEAEVTSFVKDPISFKAIVSDEDRRRMADLKSKDYLMKYDAFIPTFRRIDYLFESGVGEKYLLIITMGWNGTPKVWFRRVES